MCHTELTGYLVFAIFVVSATQVSQFSFCVITDVYVPIWLQYFPVVFQITLGALMCLLTVIRLVQEFLQMRKATKHVKLNRYMECLVREGTIYFIVCVHVFSFTGSLSRHYADNSSLRIVSWQLQFLFCCVMQRSLQRMDSFRYWLVWCKLYLLPLLSPDSS